MEAEDMYALLLTAEEMDLPYQEAKRVFERKYLEDLLPRCKTYQDVANRMGVHRVRFYRILAQHGLLTPRGWPNPYAGNRLLALAWNKGYRNLDPGPMREGCPYERAYQRGLADREEALKNSARPLHTSLTNPEN